MYLFEYDSKAYFQSRQLLCSRVSSFHFCWWLTGIRTAPCSCCYLGRGGPSLLLQGRDISVFSQFQRPQHFPRRPCTAARAQLWTCFWGGGWGASSLTLRRLGCHWTPKFSFSICHPAFGERSLSPEGKRHVPSGKSRRIGRARRRATKESHQGGAVSSPFQLLSMVLYSSPFLPSPSECWCGGMRSSPVPWQSPSTLSSPSPSCFWLCSPDPSQQILGLTVAPMMLGANICSPIFFVPMAPYLRPGSDFPSSSLFLSRTVSFTRPSSALLKVWAELLPLWSLLLLPSLAKELSIGT